MFALRHLDALDLTCAQSHAVPAPVAYFVQNSAGLPMAYVVQESAGTGGNWRENLESLGELIKAKEISNASKTNILITVKTMLSYFKAFLSSPTDEHIDEILSELMKLKQSIKRATNKNQKGLDSESLKDEDVKRFCDYLNTFLQSDFIPTIETNFPADQLHLENFSHAIAAIITERNNSMLDCMDSVVQCMKFYVDNKGSSLTTGKRALPASDEGPAKANSFLTQPPPKAAKTIADVSTKNPLQSGVRAATKIVVFVKDKNGETNSKTLDLRKVGSTASSKFDFSVSELLREYGANTDVPEENEILKFVKNKQYKCHKYQLFPTEKTRFLFNDFRPQDEITDKEATLADISKINSKNYKKTRDDNICEFAIVFDLTNHASVQEQGPAKVIQYATRVLVYVGKTENRHIDRIQHMIEFENNATVNDVVQRFADKLQGNERLAWQNLNGNISLYKRQFEYDEFRPPNYIDVQVNDLEHELVDFNKGQTEMTMKQVQNLNSDAYKKRSGNNSANFAIEIRLNPSPEAMFSPPKPAAFKCIRFILQNRQKKTFGRLNLPNDECKTKTLQNMLDVLQTQPGFNLMTKKAYTIAKKEMLLGAEDNFNETEIFKTVKKHSHGIQDIEKMTHLTMHEISNIEKEKFIKEQKQYSSSSLGKTDDDLKYAFVLVIKIIDDDTNSKIAKSERDSSQKQQVNTQIASTVAQGQSNDEWPEEVQSVINKFSDSKTHNFQKLKIETIQSIKKLPTKILVGLLQSFNNLEEEIKNLDVWFKKRETVLRRQWSIIETSSEESSSDED